jgi:hypothetical protein
MPEGKKQHFPAKNDANRRQREKLASERELPGAKKVDLSPHFHPIRRPVQTAKVKQRDGEHHAGQP